MCESSASWSIHVEKFMATSQLAPEKLNLALHVTLLLPTSLEGFRVCFQISGTGGPLRLHAVTT